MVRSYTPCRTPCVHDRHHHDWRWKLAHPRFFTDSVPTVIEAATRIRWPEGFGWSVARFGGAGTVALGSAVISYGRLRDLLVAWHYTSLAAAVGPLVLDGLMVVCGFALLAINHATGYTHHTDRQQTPSTRQ